MTRCSSISVDRLLLLVVLRVPSFSLVCEVLDCLSEKERPSYIGKLACVFHGTTMILLFVGAVAMMAEAFTARKEFLIQMILDMINPINNNNYSIKDEFLGNMYRILRCCGANNYKDYSELFAISPPSECKMHHKNGVLYYSEGCAKRFSVWLKEWAGGVALTAVITSCIQVCLLFFCFQLVKILKNLPETWPATFARPAVRVDMASKKTPIELNKLLLKGNNVSSDDQTISRTNLGGVRPSILSNPVPIPLTNSHFEHDGHPPAIAQRTTSLRSHHLAADAEFSPPVPEHKTNFTSLRQVFQGGSSVPASGAEKFPKEPQIGERVARSNEPGRRDILNRKAWVGQSPFQNVSLNETNALEEMAEPSAYHHYHELNWMTSKNFSNQWEATETGDEISAARLLAKRDPSSAVASSLKTAKKYGAGPESMASGRVNDSSSKPRSECETSLVAPVGTIQYGYENVLPVSNFKNSFHCP